MAAPIRTPQLRRSPVVATDEVTPAALHQQWIRAAEPWIAPVLVLTGSTYGTEKLDDIAVTPLCLATPDYQPGVDMEGFVEARAARMNLDARALVVDVLLRMRGLYVQAEEAARRAGGLDRSGQLRAFVQTIDDLAAQYTR